MLGIYANALNKDQRIRFFCYSLQLKHCHGRVYNEHGQASNCMTAFDTRGNFFAPLTKAVDRELVETLVDDPTVRIVSTGQVTPEGYWYDQTEHEFVLLLCGAAVLHFEADKRRITLAAGDWVEIPAHVRHRVDWIDPDAPTVWLAMCRRRAG